MGNVFKMLVTSATQQSENDLKWPLTEYQTSQRKCSFIPSASASFNTCSNEFCFPFCFHMCPLHTAVLPDHHGVDPLKAFVGTQCQSGRTSGLTTGSDGRFVFEKDQRWGFSAGSWLQTVWRLKVCIDQPVFFSLRHFRPPRCYSSHSEGCKVSAPHLSSRLPPPHLGLYFPW